MSTSSSMLSSGSRLMAENGGCASCKSVQRALGNVCSPYHDASKAIGTIESAVAKSPVVGAGTIARPNKLPLVSNLWYDLRQRESDPDL